MTNNSLPAHQRHDPTVLAARIHSPHELGGASLTGLFVSTAVTRSVVVAAWTRAGNTDAQPFYTFCDLDGTPLEAVEDAHEALVMLAMCESVEDAFALDALRRALDDLEQWGGTQLVGTDESHPLRLAIDNAARCGRELSDVVRGSDSEAEAGGREPAGAPAELITASAARLDAMGGRARLFEDAWQVLERTASVYSDSAGDGDASIQQLWEAMGRAKYAALSRPVATIVELAHATGEVFAADALAASPLAS